MQAHQLQPEIDQSHPQLIGEKYAYFYFYLLVLGGLSNIHILFKIIKNYEIKLCRLGSRIRKMEAESYKCLDL